MIFGDQVVTEITVPSNVPFQPGYNVIGIGTEVPDELIGFGFDAVIIFYTDNWDTSATTPRVKFFFIGVNGNSLVEGYGYSNNPSTTPTATVIATNVLKLTTSGSTGLSQWVLVGSRYPTAFNAPLSLLFNMFEAPPPFDGGGVFASYDAGARKIFQIQPESSSPSRGPAILLIDGSTQNTILQWVPGTERWQFGSGSANGFDSWQACTYANGWSAKAAPGFGQRSGVGVKRYPDGTVQLTGVANVGTGTPGTYCVQLPSSAYWPVYGKTFLCFQEASPDYVGMTVNSGNGAITIAGTTSATGAVHFECSWATI